jgi:putative Holliday junction resolvase
MTVVALDVGEARIGVAVSDPSLTTALPLTVITRLDLYKDIDRILEVAEEYGADTIVCGLPLTLSGEEGPQAVETKTFADALLTKTSARVIYQDERFSTREAERVMAEQHVKPAKRKTIVDKIAAAILLQTYLDGSK